MGKTKAGKRRKPECSLGKIQTHRGLKGTTLGNSLLFSKVFDLGGVSHLEIPESFEFLTH